MRRHGESEDQHDPFVDPDRIRSHRERSDGQHRGPASDRRRWVVLGSAGVLAAAAVVGSVFALSWGDDPAESTNTSPRRVALSSDGLPAQATQQNVTDTLPYARAALAGGLPTPQGAQAATSSSEVPAALLTAYRRAEATMAQEQPACRVPWWVLAGVGKVETNHANGGRVDASANALPAIRGPRLDGTIVGTRIVGDTDGGRLDSDALYDRAMGPMQMLPSTWELLARDGNGDNAADPDNVDDATLTAAAFLCSSGQDFATPEGLATGTLYANDRTDWVGNVLAWGSFYRAGITPPAVSPAPKSTGKVTTRSATTGTPAIGVTDPTPGGSVEPGKKPAPVAAPSTPPPAIPPVKDPAGRPALPPLPANPAPRPADPAPRPADPDPVRPAPEPTSTREPNPRPTSEPTRDPEPTRNPWPTRDPEPTQNPWPTRDPEPTQNPEPTRDPRPTRDPEPTRNPWPTRDPEPTRDPRPTRDPEPTITSSPEPSTPRPTRTRVWPPRPTPTSVPTVTATATATFTPTPRPTSTSTPAPPPSPTSPPSPQPPATTNPVRPTEIPTSTAGPTTAPTRTAAPEPSETETARPTEPSAPTETTDPTGAPGPSETLPA